MMLSLQINLPWFSSSLAFLVYEIDMATLFKLLLDGALSLIAVDTLCSQEGYTTEHPSSQEKISGATLEVKKLTEQRWGETRWL